MKSIPAWLDKIRDHDTLDQCIYDLCFNPDGSQVVVAAGPRVVVYNANDGSMVQSLKGHKDLVYCVNYAKDGKRFASGGADKNVIIWTSKLEGVLKYNHSEAVQCLAFNPVSHHLASCTLSEIALWSSEQKSIQKHKTGGRVNACSWTPDGQYLALGMATGVVSIRNKAGEEKVRIERPGGLETPIWALAWSPRKEDNFDVLCVTDWGQTMSFYSLNGKMLGKERALGFEPLRVSYMNNGEYILVAGCNNVCTLMTRDGIKLGTIGDKQNSWVWCCAANPSSSHVAIGCQDGKIACYKVTFSIVHGLYKERYAFRENLTDVIIQNLLNEQKVRIKCRDLVEKIAIYRHRLAVQLAERIVIYELYAGESSGMHYRVREKINSKFQCTLLVVCSNHLVICQGKRLQCLSFAGVKEREWEMDSVIRYMKVVGGPPNREGLLVGLDSGQVWKIFLDNVFPVNVLKVNSAVLCLDLSPNKQKLAVVNEDNQCLVYDVASKQLLFQEGNASSVAWNSSCEDMLCFSGNGLLSIKANNFPVHQQKLMGWVVGFSGSKIFCLNASVMSAIEVPLSAPMYQYLDKKLFREAYLVACLGVTDGDWKALAFAALEALDLDIARRSFIRIKDLKHLDLISDVQEREKRGEKEKEIFLADILAYKGKFKEAARLYQRSNNEQKALSMYTDLRMFDLAQEFIGSSESMDRKALLRKKADWAQNINEPRAAAEMYLSAGDTVKAVEIISENGWIDMLAEVGRKTTKSDSEVLRRVAKALHSNNQLDLAAEMYRKLGEEESVVAMHVEAKQWNEAFSLVERHPQYKHLVFVPYAEWLAENDKFVEAQKAYYEAGQPEQSFKVVKQLTTNAVQEGRYQDAGYYYWLLSKQSLQFASENNRVDVLSQYYEYEKYACIYYAYHSIQRYLEEPFTAYQPEALFNIARYLMQEIKVLQPPGISQFAILYALSKHGRTLGAYKLARQVLEKIQHLRIPAKFQEYVDTASLMVKGKPYHDSEDLLIMCYRCSSYNPLLTTHTSSPNACTNCKQPFVHSFITFEVLPLIEFQIEDGLSDIDAMKLLETPVEMETDGWSQVVDSNVQAMRPSENIVSFHDPFTDRLVNYDGSSEEFSPIVLNSSTLQAMDFSSVVVCRYPKPLRYRYYRNMMPDIQVTVCFYCNKIFHVDDFEMKLLEKGYCPFCRSSPESNSTAETSSLL